MDIPADDAYRVVYNSLDRLAVDQGGLWDRRGQRYGGQSFLGREIMPPPGELADFALLENVTMAPAVLLPSDGLSEDVLAHEFGHGHFAVHFRGDSTMTSTCGFQRVDESVADTIALLEDGFYLRSLDEQLELRDAMENVVRGHGDPLVSDPGQCAGYQHLSDADPLDAPDCAPHENSCILTRIWALGREADETGSTVSLHGVDVDPIGFDEAKALSRDMVTSYISTGTDLIPYGHSYLQAVAARFIACGFLGGPCPVPRITAPMWAVGLWSPQQPLGLGHDTVVGPAVGARDGSVWVFFVPPPGPAGGVHVYQDDDVLEPTPGAPPILLETLLGSPFPQTSTDLAAARTGELVSLAVVPTSGDGVFLARTTSTSDPTWVPGSTFFSVPRIEQGIGTITLTHVGDPDGPGASDGRLFVVELTNALDGRSELAYFTDLDPTVRLVIGSQDESSPALARAVDGSLELWSVTRPGNLRRRVVNDPLAPEVSFGAPEPIAVPGAAPGDPARLFGGRGLAVGAHLTRTQVFARTLSGDVLHHARGVDVGGFVDIGESSRRPAVFTQMAPDGRPAQVVLGVGDSAGRADALMVRYHESD